MPLEIVLQKAGIPEGSMLLADLDGLCGAIQEAVIRIIERDMGYPATGEPHAEAGRLGRLILSQVEPGSTVLVCDGLKLEGFRGRHPAIVAATELVRGIDQFAANGDWPKYLPGSVRRTLSQRFAAVITDGTMVRLKVRDQAMDLRCEIGRGLFSRLSVPEPHVITGNLNEIDRSKKHFSVDTPARVQIEYGEAWEEKVDQHRWQRVTVKAEIDPVQPRKPAKNVREIRAAGLHEPNGVASEEKSVAESNLAAIEASSAFGSVSARLTEIRSLEADWDSYGAPRIGPEILDFAVEFAKTFLGMLIVRGVEPRAPFVVPTRTGGVQFEWDEGNRSLEVEILGPDRYLCFWMAGAEQGESESPRWEILRRILWFETGEPA